MSQFEVDDRRKCGQLPGCIAELRVRDGMIDRPPASRGCDVITVWWGWVPGWTGIKSIVRMQKNFDALRCQGKSMFQRKQWFGLGLIFAVGGTICSLFAGTVIAGLPPKDQPQLVQPPIDPPRLPGLMVLVVGNAADPQLQSDITRVSEAFARRGFEAVGTEVITVAATVTGDGIASKAKAAGAEAYAVYVVESATSRASAGGAAKREFDRAVLTAIRSTICTSPRALSIYWGRSMSLAEGDIRAALGAGVTFVSADRKGANPSPTAALANPPVSAFGLALSEVIGAPVRLAYGIELSEIARRTRLYAAGKQQPMVLRMRASGNQSTSQTGCQPAK
jgi:hypothetical protein